MKKCCKCKVEKELSEFSKSKSRKDGHKNHCKACCKEYNKTYYLDNKEAIKEYKKQYRRNNKEARLEYKKQYYQNNPEASRKSGRKYSRKRRAIKLAVQENYTNEKATATEIAFGNKCFNCGSTNKLCHDHHYPLSKGYALDIGNSVLLCQSCNSSKRDKDPEDFYSEEQLADLEVHFKIQRDIYTLAYLHKV